MDPALVASASASIVVPENLIRVVTPVRDFDKQLLRTLHAVVTAEI